MKRTYTPAKNLLVLAIALFAMLAVPAAAQNAQYRKITPEAAKKMLAEDKTATLVDVRTPEEYSQGHIEGSVLIPNFELADKAETLLPDKNKPVIVYCRSGNRSLGSAQWLINQGYTKVYDLGGINRWPYGTVK